MSGSFNEIDVPPTLVSFAVDVAKEGDIITPELKAVGNQLVLFSIEKDSYDLPVYAQVMKLYAVLHELIRKGCGRIRLCAGWKRTCGGSQQDGIWQ